MAGEIVDRGLQLGTGTTDILVGRLPLRHVRADLGLLRPSHRAATAQFPQRIQTGHGIEREPRPALHGFSAFQPELQLNARAEKREQGVNADVDNSGATLVI